MFFASLIMAGLMASQPAGVEAFEPQGFTASFSVEIAAPRETVFDAATGDITGWWDHSFALDPAVLAIEPVAGGRFYEQLRPDSEDGALHARVIYVDAPAALRLHGPLGLSGRAVDLVASWTLEPVAGDDGEATQFRVDLAMSGQIDAELAGIVLATWQHFIAGRLKPWVEAGCHLAPQAPCPAWDEP
ncbi:SRPBCC family protein [Maricaulis sp.]|uniref:SRPBCC family protein n=1 Tax=Maricaulis sp. TaxID=1486257 RepID=UPI003A92D9E2